MSSITSWTRLEPRSRANDLSVALQAQVHDPLWLLTRQWQLGELTGQDAGSPVSVRVETDVMPITELRLKHEGSFTAYDRRIPLETVVEREPVPDLAQDLSLAVDAGLFFLRLLGDQGLGQYREAFIRQFPLVESNTDSLDKNGKAFVRLMAGRALNGHTLLNALDAATTTGTFPVALGVAASHLDPLLHVASMWLDWWRVLYSHSPTSDSAWQANRMEYQFGLSAANEAQEITLEAPEYPGGRLDWFDFVAKSEHSRPAAKTVEPDVHIMLPAAVHYPGMPLDRFWELEDARIHFGGVENDPSDLPRKLLMAYAIAYSNDWFLVPVELPVGSITRVKRLIVADTFGGQTLIRQVGDDGQGAANWSLFRLAGEGSKNTSFDGLFLVPTLPDGLESRPIEEVRFIRDEMANVAWAIERLVEGRTGRPVDQRGFYEVHRSHLPPQPLLADADTTLTYRLATDVPEYWFALLPVETAKLRLQPHEGDNGISSGQLLRKSKESLEEFKESLEESEEPLEIYSEEIPREGVHITRAWQLVRWSDGSTHVWRGRHKTAGTGEGASGLLFDVVERGS